jgi:hypothetical protein
MLALAFSPSGALYGVKGSTNSPIITIDPKTGAGTPFGNAGVSSLVGLAWAPVTTGVEDPPVANTRPADFILMQNYPNPFNSQTTIAYQIAKSGFVRLSVSNLLGQVVTTLVDGEQSAGSHRVIWNGYDAEGRSIPSGIYYINLQAGGQVNHRKMVLMR